MGMDALEIVMAAEEAFDIQITDAEAEKMRTPGELIQLVLGKVGRTDVAACLTQRSFNRLRRALLRQLPLARRDLRPDTPASRILPRWSRRRLLRSVMADLEISEIPELNRPWLVGVIIFAGAIVMGLGFAKGTPGDAMAIGVATGGLTIWLGLLLTRWLRLEFKPAQATVGGLARWVVARKPALVGAPPGQWSREQVAARVRDIVVNVLACDDRYREDANFVKDLGLE